MTSRSALLHEGERIMVICNACRYCEGYCAVFPAMEQRRAFPVADLHYLANLCHNCGECLYACQYAPPHEFAINVPRTFAQLRLQSYEDYAWPPALASAFKRHSVATSLGLSVAFTIVMLAFTAVTGQLTGIAAGAGFYDVLPHQAMIALFGAVSLFVLAALGAGFWRFQRGTAGSSKAAAPDGPALLRGLRDAMSLRYLHGHGEDCTYAGEEDRRPWRRWFHHCTFYGFLLCFAATTVAAIYHSVLGLEAPYGYFSLPVVLGTVGGAGLLVGPTGLYWLGTRRDEATADPEQPPLDRGFVVMLGLTSATGLLLLGLRHTAAMAPLLMAHLGTVLALFVTLPYGKFVHGIYRTAALARYSYESRGRGN